MVKDGEKNKRKNRAVYGADGKRGGKGVYITTGRGEKPVAR